MERPARRLFRAIHGILFLAAYAQIDWARGVEFLDKELQKINADAALGRRTVDKLVKVWLKSGNPVIALTHCEVQGEREADFAERVYTYHHRISDRFNERVASFVILTDSHKRWRPREFQYELLGTRLSLKFSIAKLLDYQKRITGYGHEVALIGHSLSAYPKKHGACSTRERASFACRTASAALAVV